MSLPPRPGRAVFSFHHQRVGGCYNLRPFSQGWQLHCVDLFESSGWWCTPRRTMFAGLQRNSASHQAAFPAALPHSVPSPTVPMVCTYALCGNFYWRLQCEHPCPANTRRSDRINLVFCVRSALRGQGTPVPLKPPVPPLPLAHTVPQLPCPPGSMQQTRAKLNATGIFFCPGQRVSPMKGFLALSASCGCLALHG